MVISTKRVIKVKPLYFVSEGLPQLT